LSTLLPTLFDYDLDIKLTSLGPLTPLGFLQFPYSYLFQD